MDFFGTVKKILSMPAKFFSGLKKENTLANSFLYFAIITAFSTVMGFIFQTLFPQLSYDILKTFYGLNFPNTHTFSIVARALFTIIGYAIMLGFSFAVVGLLHLWIMIFDGKEEYVKTYQLYAYSSTPNALLGWIPFISSVTWIWGMILLIIGTQKMHGIPKNKAILMYVIPAIILVIIYILFLILFIPFLKTILANLPVQ